MSHLPNKTVHYSKGGNSILILHAFLLAHTSEHLLTKFQKNWTTKLQATSTASEPLGKYSYRDHPKFQYDLCNRSEGRTRAPRGKVMKASIHFVPRQSETEILTQPTASWLKPDELRLWKAENVAYSPPSPPVMLQGPLHDMLFMTDPAGTHRGNQVRNESSDCPTAEVLLHTAGE